MMELSIDGGRTAFEPGETIDITAEWQLDKQPESMELRLVWYTRGKGETDVSVADRAALEFPSLGESRTLKHKLPMAPYSFSGKLISLCWSIELVADHGDDSHRLDITIAPGAREVLLYGEE